MLEIVEEANMYGNDSAITNKEMVKKLTALSKEELIALVMDGDLRRKFEEECKESIVNDMMKKTPAKSNSAAGPFYNK